MAGNPVQLELAFPQDTLSQAGRSKAGHSAIVLPFPVARRARLVRWAAEQIALLPRDAANDWLRQHLRQLRRGWAELDIPACRAAPIQADYVREVRRLAAFLRADRHWRPSGQPSRRA